MKTLTLTFVLILLNTLCICQNIKTENEAILVKNIVDQQTNLKDFIIAPTIFNSKGQTFPGKFSYKFIYDTSNTSLVKVEVTEVESKKIESLYFRNDQLVLITSKNNTEYFFDADFEIPYWGAATNKETIKRDKYKETAYRLLITFKKYSKKNLNRIK